mgnify:CR=1 FL=1
MPLKKLVFVACLFICSYSWAYNETDLEKLKSLNTCERCNLAGANFTDNDLTDANLAGANLAGADFTNANLSNTNLHKAVLTNANLTDAGYAVSIDKLKGELRPKFESQNIDIEFSSALSSNVSLKGKQIRLDVSSNTDSYQNDDIVYQGGSLGGASAAGTVRSVVANSTIVRLYLHNANGTFTATTVKTNGSSKTSTLMFYFH